MQRWLVVVGLLVVLCVAPIRAQFVQSPDDKGAADTLQLVVTEIPDVATNKKRVILQLYAFNDSNSIASASSGFGWVSPTFRMDSAFMSPLSISSFNFTRFVYYADNIDSTNNRDRFPFAGARISGNGVPPGPARRLWASYYFSVSTWALMDSIIVDTFTYNGGVTLKFVDNLNKNYKPFVKVSRIVIRDTAYTPPANILISPDTLHFSAIQGGSNPPNQSVLVTSDGATLSLTVTESIPWITRSPTLGSTPLNVNVGANITSLVPGIYFDSIQVSAPNSINSPEFIYVRLVVAAPAPRISVTPTSLTFNALIGQPNPPPKILTIKNIGGSTLNWTVTKSQSWLSLSPGGGIDSGGVSASVDITALVAGTYFDTVIVSDPAANNNPQHVPVTLSVGTSLPTIETDSTTLIFIVNPAEGIIFSRSFEIRNAGVGALSYTVTESSSRILSLTNPSGSAPGTVTLNYKLSTNANGQNYTDTVIITSPEAVNSPYQQIIQLRCRSNPSVVQFNPDTISFTVFECQQGSVPLPFEEFQVINQGFDNPMTFALTGESDFFTLDHTSGEAPDNFFLFAQDAGRPLGTYYDTIVATAVGSLNKKDTLIVRYDVVPGPEPHNLVLNRYQIVVPYQEESGPVNENGLTFANPLGGCTSYKVTEDIDWLFPNDPDTGRVPDEFKVIVDAPGYLFGEYLDTIVVTSAGAQNSPIIVPTMLRVWRFHGDVDYNLSLDIGDLTQMVSYLFFYDEMWDPQPTLLVGDLDCDDHIDIGDLTYFIQYLFMGGPIPCGNPY